jgi:hypothetical protein
VSFEDGEVELYFLFGLFFSLKGRTGDVGFESVDSASLLDYNVSREIGEAMDIHTAQVSRS